jgi:hypothetical protein
VADQTSGIEVMRRRMERASRRPPPPRRARDDADGPAGGGGETPLPAAVQAPPRPAAAPAPRRARAPEAAPARLAADLPPANLAIRVRKPLDDRLAELIHALRRDGVRTSKVELIEMLLWELPDDPVAARERLRRFRGYAPRGAGAPLDQG